MDALTWQRGDNRKASPARAKAGACIKSRALGRTHISPSCSPGPRVWVRAHVCVCVCNPVCHALSSVAVPLIRSASFNLFAVYGAHIYYHTHTYIQASTLFRFLGKDCRTHLEIHACALEVRVLEKEELGKGSVCSLKKWPLLLIPSLQFMVVTLAHFGPPLFFFLSFF